jgi:NADPH-dependent curcumin reductase CurA
MNVLVSGAAGATGSVAAQIAKLNGCNVIGIAGGESKCSWLKNDCGLDEVIDYKNSSVADELKTKAKNGIDLFFDNVGGEILESALNHINLNAKVLLCGGISGYNSTEPLPGPRNLMNLVIRRATIEGFLVMDYLPNSQKALEQLEEYLENNQLKHQEDILTGIENCPDALNRLFTGQNIGKQLVEV